jgi:hypothetical protein
MSGIEMTNDECRMPNDGSEDQGDRVGERK